MLGKYPQLVDREWLYTNYVIAGRSTYDIGRELDCDAVTVRAWLIRHGIIIRTNSKGAYPLLCDRSWLIKNYVNRHMSIYDIASEIGCHATSVANSLFNFGIICRTPRETYFLNREDDGFHLGAMSLINGCLLGDASITITNSGRTAAFRKNNKHYDHLFYVAERIFKTNPAERITQGGRTLKGKFFPINCLGSLGHEMLVPLFHKWYPESNNRVKIVPSDFVLDAESLLHWFLDDGSASYHSVSGKRILDRVRIDFSSQSFTREENQFLCDQIKSNFGIRAITTPAENGSGWKTDVPMSQSGKFYEVIGPCPDNIPNMRYKWKNVGPARTHRLHHIELADREWLVKHRVELRMTHRAIGQLIGANHKTVALWLVKHNISSQPQ